MFESNGPDDDFYVDVDEIEEGLDEWIAESIEENYGEVDNDI